MNESTLTIAAALFLVCEIIVQQLDNDFWTFVYSFLQKCPSRTAGASFHDLINLVHLISVSLNKMEISFS